MARKTDNLRHARAVKNDEFYTQYCDIEKECSNYLGHFFNKVIYCNCDTAESNFVRYFQTLKELGAIKDILYSGGLDGADFRSPEALAMLNKADIVITNPPFSLFREYVAQLVEHNKKFLIIGNHNAINYKSIFNLIIEHKLWVGTRPFGGSGGMYFYVPNSKQLPNSGKHYMIIDKIPMAKISAAWFTNLEHNKQKPLVLNKTYAGNEITYPKYDNADVINVNRKGNIPNDYDGIIGVPITFIDRYNPKEFEILGLDKEFTTDGKNVRINGKNLYTRIFIRKKLA